MADNNVGIFVAVVFIMAPTILIGLLAILLGITPVLDSCVIVPIFMEKMTYTIDDNVLSISAPLKSLVIGIDSIKKIQRGKYWVERGRITQQLTSSCALSMTEPTISMCRLKMRNHSWIHFRP